MGLLGVQEVTTKAERRHKDRVARLGCILCQCLDRGETPAQVHHIREGQGMSQRASDFLTIPLCPSCHQGPNGIHGDRTLLKIARVDELDLLAMTIERLCA